MMAFADFTSPTVLHSLSLSGQAIVTNTLMVQGVGSLRARDGMHG